MIHKPLINCKNNMRYSGYETQTGFTLIEIAVAMCLTLLVLAPVVGLFVSLSRSYTTQEKTVELQQTVRAGMDFMLHDLRLAGLDPLGSANAGVEIAQTSKIRITSDRNLNGSIDESDDESVTYLYDAAANRIDQILYEGSDSEESRNLADHVAALVFAYRDVNGAVTTTPADIRSIEITMAIEDSAGREQAVRRTYTTRVACRNMAL